MLTVTAGKELWISLEYLTSAGSNVRAIRSMLALWLLEGFFELHVRVLWPAMMRVVDGNRCFLRIQKNNGRLGVRRTAKMN